MPSITKFYLSTLATFFASYYALKLILLALDHGHFELTLTYILKYGCVGG